MSDKPEDKTIGDDVLESAGKAQGCPSFNHIELHKKLDELVACFLDKNRDKHLRDTTVMELIEWSYRQTTDKK